MEENTYKPITGVSNLRLGDKFEMNKPYSISKDKLWLIVEPEQKFFDFDVRIHITPITQLIYCINMTKVFDIKSKSLCIDIFERTYGFKMELDESDGSFDMRKDGNMIKIYETDEIWTQGLKYNLDGDRHRILNVLFESQKYSNLYIKEVEECKKQQLNEELNHIDTSML